MIRDATEPCPLCGRKPKMHATHFPGEPEGFVISCVGEKHCVAVYKIGGPDETVEEWDRRMTARPPAGA